MVIAGALISVIDDIADLPGFGEAMESVGWARQEKNRLVLPRFFAQYNVEPAKDEKEKNAERQRRFREKSNGSRNGDVTLHSNARIEKSRVEEERINSLPTAGASPESLEIVGQCILPKGMIGSERCRLQFAKWQHVRKNRHGAFMDPVAFEATAMKLSAWDEQKWYDALVKSTAASSMNILDPTPPPERPPRLGNGKPAKPAGEYRDLNEEADRRHAARLAKKAAGGQP